MRDGDVSLVLPATGEVIAHGMRQRNAASCAFFEREAERLAAISRRMAERFERGGRLLAFGVGAAASDAQHIAVEFVHPVLVGKRALPALDVSAVYESLPAILRSDDMVVGFDSPKGDARIGAALREARSRGALTLALSGPAGDYSAAPPSSDPFVHQEVIEILYHVLWETVHVFFERRVVGEASAAASFLYPFLGTQRQTVDAVVPEVAASIRSKVRVVAQLRDRIVADQSENIGAAATAIRERVASGGAMLCVGNGGSATDAMDLAHDLVASPKGYARIPAISLASDAATLTAIANDVGVEAIFARQLIAQGRRGDIAVAISTSGNSPNIVAALAEARARGMLTVALLGYDGGDVVRHQLADYAIVVHSDQIPRIQEVQASVYHVMVELLHAPGLSRH